MRRFFSLLMCVSGMSLAVTASQADEPAAAAAGQAPQAEATEAPSPVDWATESRNRYENLRDRLQSLYRLEIGDDEFAARIEKMATRAQGLYEESRSIAEKQAGEGLERARTDINERFARLEKSLEEAEARSRGQGDRGATERDGDAEPAESRAGRIARRLAEVELTELRAMLEKLQQSASEETEAARITVERQIDELERFLAERREQRDAVREKGRDVEPSAPEARLRHLNAAVEHLEAAGLRDVAMHVRKHVHELQHEIAREEIARQRRQRAALEQPGVEDERRHLNEQVEELRSEVRRLRAEMEQLRNEQPKVTKPAPDNPG